VDQPVSRHRFSCLYMHFGVSPCAEISIFGGKNAVLIGLRNRGLWVRVPPGAFAEGEQSPGASRDGLLLHLDRTVKFIAVPLRILRAVPLRILQVEREKSRPRAQNRGRKY